MDRPVLFAKQRQGESVIRYKNLGGDSKVASYEIGETSITIQFRDTSTYLYTEESTGKADLDRMKELAIAGQGLNTFIGKRIKTRYAKKIR
jgi:hypothetical protein